MRSISGGRVCPPAFVPSFIYSLTKVGGFACFDKFRPLVVPSYMEGCCSKRQINLPFTLLSARLQSEPAAKELEPGIAFLIPQCFHIRTRGNGERKAVPAVLSVKEADHE